MTPERPSGELLLLAFAVLLLPGELARAQTKDELRQRGVQALQSQNFAVARQAFLRLVQLEPSAYNYNYLATAEAADGQVDGAIVHLEKSIQLGNRTASAYYNLGLLEVQAKRLDAAKTNFQQAIDLDPRYPPARYGLGVALLSSGRPHEAAALMERTLDQLPHEARFWALLVNAQFAAGDSQKAVTSTQNAVQDFAAEPRLDVTLATICLRYRQVQRARELLEDANELLPNDPEVALLVAKASLLAGEPVEAMAVLQGMAPADRRSPERLRMMGESRALLGDLASASNDLQLALNDSPRDPECLVSFAWLQNLQGHCDGAISTLAQARSLLPQAPWIPYLMAVSYYLAGKYGQVEKACQEALRLDSKFASAYMVRGIAKRSEKHFEAASMDIAKAVALAPDDPLFHREFGVTLYDSGKAPLAKEQFDLALHWNPKDADSYFWRSKSLQATGEKEKAIADLNAAIDLKPGYADAYRDLARLYSETGRPSQAAEVLAQQKQAGAFSQPSGDETILHTLPDATR